MTITAAIRLQRISQSAKPMLHYSEERGTYRADHHVLFKVCSVISGGQKQRTAAVEKPVPLLV